MPRAWRQPQLVGQHQPITETTDHFTLLTEERMIGGPLERAIEDLGDYGVKADIMRLRNLESDRRKLALRLQEVQALEAYTQKRRAEFGMYQLAHVGRTKAVRQRLYERTPGNASCSWWMRISERGELAWRHRTHHRQDAPLPRAGTLRSERRSTEQVSWNSDNAKTMPSPKTSMRSASAAPTARGSTTSPLTARPPTISARPPLRAGAACPATTDSSATRCRTPVLTEDDATMPTAITSPANATLATSPSKSDEIEYDHHKAGCDDLCKGRTQ